MSSLEIEPLLLKLMSSVILFRGLEREDLVDLLRSASKIIFQAGDLVFEEGFSGHSLYVVVNGKFEIFKQIGTKEATIASVTPGEHFGEIALVTDRLRTASVRALEESIALRLTKSAIFSQPKVAVFLLKNIAGLMADHLLDKNNEVMLLDASRRHHEKIAKKALDAAAKDPTRPQVSVRNVG